MSTTETNVEAGQVPEVQENTEPVVQQTTNNEPVVTEQVAEVEQPKDVEQTPPAVTQVSAAAPAVTEIQQLLEVLKESGTVYEKMLVNSMGNYCKKMAPGVPVSNEAGVQEQYLLWTTLRSVIQKAPDEEFKRLWSIVLAIAEDQKDGAFTDSCLFRFSEYWRADLEELTGFQRILNLIKVTSNVESRNKNIRTVDLTRTLDKGINEYGRSRLVSYYQ